MATTKNTITAKDLYRFEIIQGSEISPDGQHVLYGVQWVDKATEKKYSNLWIAPTNGGKPYRFTSGKHNDSQATWSPDGKKIAFVSNRADKKQAQIYLIDFEKGGEAQVVSDVKGSIGSLSWSPDGKKILFDFRAKDKEIIRREADKKAKELGIVCRHYTNVFFKYDGEGFLPKNHWGFAILSIKSGKINYLKGDKTRNYTSATWSPNGKFIAYVANPSKVPDLNLGEDEIYIMPSKGGKARRLKTGKGSKFHLAFSPNGKYIAYFGDRMKGNWWQNTAIWVVQTDGKKQAENLTAEYDIAVDTCTLADIVGSPEMSPPLWSADGKRLYFQVTRHGNNTIYFIDRKTKELQVLFGQKGAAGSLSMDKGKNHLAFVYGKMDDPAQIMVKNADGETWQLTHCNKWLQKKKLGNMEEVWFKGAAGNDLQGWILTPPNFDPKKKYPSILEIHGGPLTQYGEAFMHEFYYLAAKGYVVYFCNPRGGRGYGEAHARSIWDKGWGTDDYDDVMAWADFMAEKPYIDTKRMGVTGGSYGGYMTNWIIGHTNRFKAAVTQRSVSNFISMWGSSDGNWIFQQVVGDKMPFEDIEKYWEMSPMKYMGNAKTPTLVIHSEMDYRCCQEQGEQVFVALKKLGVDTELVLFPNEPHGLSRMGRTDRRIARLEHISRWFDKYLK